MTFARSLTWSEWILWCLREEPERIFDEAERAASTEAFLASQARVRGGRLETPAEVRERLDAHAWRAGRAQGLLDPVSPLRTQRSKP